MKTNFRRFRKWKLKPEEIPKFIKKVNNCPFNVYDRRPAQDEVVFPNTMYVWKTQTTIHVVARCILSTDMYEYELNDRGEDKSDTDVATMYRKFKKKIDKSFELEELGKEYSNLTSKAFMYQDPTFDGVEINAYGYDMNNCYLAALKADIPDTTKMRTFDSVKANEVGFNVNFQNKTIHTFRDGTQEVRYALEKVNKGQFAEYVFPLIESPFKTYAEETAKLIEIAKNNNDSETKNRLKTEVVCSIGNLQNHNPFVRASIVETANEKIKSLMDEYTVYCNTDCIISLRERPDLPISNKVGEFKIENTGKFIYHGFNYEWLDTGKKSQRGTNDLPVKYKYQVSKGKLLIKEN